MGKPHPAGDALKKWLCRKRVALAFLLAACIVSAFIMEECVGDRPVATTASEALHNARRDIEKRLVDGGIERSEGSISISSESETQSGRDVDANAARQEIGVTQEIGSASSLCTKQEGSATNAALTKP